MSLANRAVDETAEFLHVALLWLFLNPAFGPVAVAVSALPLSPSPLAGQEGLIAAFLTVCGVAVIRFYDPSWDLVRAFVAGGATASGFLALYVLSGADDAVPAGGSWAAFGRVVAYWLVALGVGVALAHPRTWRRLRRAVAVEERTSD
ncbi:hypothetical protein [Halobellus rubicundus]|uniref:Uncharacterized protein n=1 Tax=Halobellus rubicundus TaxID=2996466 RepID=A0ABD5M9Q2_9EURY